MGWTTPATWVVGAILTAAQLNTQVRDNERYLKGTDGEVVLEDYIDFPLTAQGDVFYHNGTKLARLAAGTSGYVLKTAGASNNPAWAAQAVNATSGSYTGDDTADRAIAHGLGVTPKAVFIYGDSATAPWFRLILGSSLAYLSETVKGIYTVTVWDVTNFHVGNAASYLQSANQSPTSYRWIAIG